jgi:hypothetical protein
VHRAKALVIVALPVASLLLLPSVASARKATATRTKTTSTTATPVTTTTEAPATTTTTVAPTTTTTTAAPLDTVLSTVSTITSESFSTTTWWAAHGLLARPWHTGVIVGPDGNPFLRTQIAAGTHDGTSFQLPTGLADHVRLTYRLRVDSAFDATQSSNNVKLPGFGSPSFDVAGICLAGCGGAGADGVTGYSARVDVANNNIPGFYVYDLPAQAYGRGVRWAAPRLAPGVWHTVKLEIAMNTPGVANGVLKATLDGVPVFTASAITFRTSPLLHVGSAWFDIYYGGSGVTPATTNVDLDDVLVEQL